MVRLRPNSLWLFPPPIKVISIPLWFDWDKIVYEIYLNVLREFPFHYGSIETTSGSSGFTRRRIFPFHNGSIETCLNVAYEELNDEEKISIPLWFDWDSEKASLHAEKYRLNFHSTMVRLRLSPDLPKAFADINFHSTMVRLRRGDLPWGDRGNATWFPFHNGSIETKSSTFMGWRCSPHFHSTMVRLRLPKNPSRERAPSDFHSTMVRLRLVPSISQPKQEMDISIPLWFDWDGWRKSEGGFVYSDFHSTMVRLRLNNYTLIYIHRQDFHSTMVRLRRRWRRAGIARPFSISIPLWFDWDVDEG